MNKQTKSTKAKDIKREWHLVDVQNEVLGRVATKIANLLMGKSKPYFVRNLDCGDYVVVINSKEIKVTGKKETDKNYYRHSGYPHGLRSETLMQLRERRPEEIIRHAVKGMLPQNRLRAAHLKRLLVFPGKDHKYEDKFRPKAELKN